MKDLKLNEDFDVVFDHRRDLETVTGREEFEQHIAIGLTRFFIEEIGSVERQSAKSRLRLHANRLVNVSERVDEVDSIIVEDSETKLNVVEVDIVYNTGEVFQVEVS